MGRSLDEIAAQSKERVEVRKSKRPFEDLKKLAERTVGNIGANGAYQSLQQAVNAKGLSVIAKIQQPSPSAEASSADFPYLDIAYDCEAGDADAIICASNPDAPEDADTMLIEMRDEVSTPLVYEDFVVDLYQVYEAKYLGADAVVLSCALLDDERLTECLDICNKLHLDALVEARTMDELARAVTSQALLIEAAFDEFGVDAVNTDALRKVREAVPADRLLVIAADISSAENARTIREAGADAIVVSKLLINVADSDERQALCREIREIA